MHLGILELAAIAFATGTTVVVAFQIALALGAPWGAYAMGGRYPGRFPLPMRVAAVIQAIVLGAIAVIVLSRAGLFVTDLTEAFAWSIWIAVVVSALSVAVNMASPSAPERRIWVPVGLVMLSSALIVALTG